MEISFSLMEWGAEFFKMALDFFSNSCWVCSPGFGNRFKGNIFPDDLIRHEGKWTRFASGLKKTEHFDREDPKKKKKSKKISIRRSRPCLISVDCYRKPCQM